MSKPRYEEDLVEDIRPAMAAREAKEICKGKLVNMIINDVENRYLQICLYTGTSPYDYCADGYLGNGYETGIPDELDLSGGTVYVIEDVLGHITDYLVSQGFCNNVSSNGGFSIVFKTE